MLAASGGEMNSSHNPMRLSIVYPPASLDKSLSAHHLDRISSDSDVAHGFSGLAGANVNLAGTLDFHSLFDQSCFIVANHSMLRHPRACAPGRGARSVIFSSPINPTVPYI